MPRSIAIHIDHRNSVALALQRNGFLTQGALAAHLEMALSTVNNFCRGVKVSVAKFEQICEALGLEASEMCRPKVSTTTSDTDASQCVDQFYAYDQAWVGRDSILQSLQAKLTNSCRLLLIAGIAGVGKTALAEKLSVELRQAEASLILLRENFDDQQRDSDFGSMAARLLENAGQTVTPDDRADVQQLMRRLVQYLKQRPILLIIDSMEHLLQGDANEGWSGFKDEIFLKFFQSLLTTDTFKSRLILTTQELPAQLTEIGSRYQNFWHCEPLNGLSTSEQQDLFTKTGLTSEPSNGNYLSRIGKAYEGHPLALRVIIGEIGSRPFFGNVTAYWQRYGHEIEEVEKALAEAAQGTTTGEDDRWQLDRFTRALRRNVQNRLEQTFARLKEDARYAYILLCETAVYRCAVPEDWWLSHLEDWDQSETDQFMALDILRDRYLVEESIDETRQENPVLLRQHNLIRSLSLHHLDILD